MNSHARAHAHSHPCSCVSDPGVYITAINQTVLDAKRFYAYGSPQTQTSDEAATREALENVWPVITLFSRLVGADGTVASLNTAVQCVRATNGTTTAPADPVSGAAGRFRVSPMFAAGGDGLVFLFVVALGCLVVT